MLLRKGVVAYVGIYSKKITKDFYVIELNEDIRSFVFLGNKDALLVDSGTGVGDLKEIIEKITDLPITALFTHAHGDHIGGAKYFNKRLMHPSEFDYYASEAEETVSMDPVWEGAIIDLGTYRFEVILIPGHSPGSIALLEKEKRFLIGGDSIQSGGPIIMLGSIRSFEAFQASMAKLSERIDEFDIIYASHNDLIVQPETIKILNQGVSKLLRNEISPEHLERFGQEGRIYKYDNVSFFTLSNKLFE